MPHTHKTSYITKLRLQTSLQPHTKPTTTTTNTNPTQISNLTMAPHIKIADKPSAEAYLQEKMPLIMDAIVETIKNGEATWTLDSDHSKNRTLVQNIVIHSRALDGWRRVTGTIRPLENVTDLPRRALSDGFRRVIGTIRPIQNVTDLPRRGLLEEEHREAANLKRAAPFLVVLAVILALVGSYILFEKVQIYLAKRKKDRVFAQLESQNQAKGYSTMVRRGSWVQRMMGK
ncbi:uncharacterized protein LY89DRAFT_723361 [Mollisia scopiformis]|uniref:Uncharacterized protein n=1 Tax=Mollisia scopiformis TaxID=149040 RepID=A0A194WS38_MOLSC|nr:uncharacterized protein LY89DRAFT_723361 [Mollisia scopiformis]KUJ10790.1 hypothetical protein LY89DRAFT_723361 [Mollisia scopiformis]